MGDIKPLGANIIVKQIEKEAKTASGIYLGEAKMTDSTAEVVATASGRVKVGDTVVCRCSSGSPISIDGEAYLVFDEDDVLAII